MVKAEQNESLDSVLVQLNKSHGEGIIKRMGSKPEKIESIPTGVLGLDVALGIGGVPRGRVVEFYGPEQCGKTSLALSIIAQAQKNGGEVAFIDAEHALDLTYVENVGIDLDRLVICQPDYGEQALDICEALIQSKKVDVIVIDSVAALVPKAELEGAHGDAHVGLHARLMSQALRKLTASMGKSKTTVIFINQIRHKIGVLYGNPEVTAGGNALKYYSSLRIDIRKVEQIKHGEEVIGHRAKAKIVKTKVGPPYKIVEFDLVYPFGISHEGSLIDLGLQNGIIQKSGAWFNYGETRLGQGRENVRTFLKENTDVANSLEIAIKDSIALFQT